MRRRPSRWRLHAGHALKLARWLADWRRCALWRYRAATTLPAPPSAEPPAKRRGRRASGLATRPSDRPKVARRAGASRPAATGADETGAVQPRRVDPRHAGAESSSTPSPSGSKSGGADPYARPDRGAEPRPTARRRHRHRRLRRRGAARRRRLRRRGRPNTLAHVAEARRRARPADARARSGSASIVAIGGRRRRPPRPVLHGRLHPLGPGKDSTTGHWELMGVVADAPLPTYPDGFPADVVARLEAATGPRFCCNRPPTAASAVIDELRRAPPARPAS